MAAVVITEWHSLVRHPWEKEIKVVGFGAATALAEAAAGIGRGGGLCLKISRQVTPAAINATGIAIARATRRLRRRVRVEGDGRRNLSMGELQLRRPPRMMRARSATPMPTETTAIKT